MANLNLSSLSGLTTAATSLSNLILVIPNLANGSQTIGYQPQNSSEILGQPLGQLPPNILFHYEGEQSVILESDITDHYVEDNTAVQDQIALRPEQITTHGFIGELNDISPAALQPLKTIAEKLTTVSSYTPEISETALIAYNTAFQLYQVGQNAVNSAVAAWGSLTSTTPGQQVLNEVNLIDISQLQSQQQIFFQKFYGYWRSRTLFTVQTPWGVFSNCAIKSLRSIQDADSRMITDFEVTFKVIRTATTTTSPAVGTNRQSRNAFQAGGPADNGTYTPPASIGVGQGLSQMGVA